VETGLGYVASYRGRPRATYFPIALSSTSPKITTLWAPDINYHNGEYVLYYAVSTIGSQISAIGAFTSPNMQTGTWTDHGEVLSSTIGGVYNAGAYILLYQRKNVWNEGTLQLILT
jgi:hypothetical protein